VLVDPTVLRQLAGLLLGPDENAERARRRDAAERELAGMELRWTRTERPVRPERPSGRHTPGGGGEANPEMGQGRCTQLKEPRTAPAPR
jgi:hypothetical protein